MSRPAGPAPQRLRARRIASLLTVLLTAYVVAVGGAAVAFADEPPAPAASPADPTPADPTPADPTTAAPPRRPGPLRVLLTGDSITEGFHGDYTWRYRLAKEFSRQSVPVDFVGSKRTPYLTGSWPSSDYADRYFDSDHFAWVGTTLQWQATVIGPEVTEQQPDVVVVASGVNDLRHGFSATEAIEHFRDWLGALRAAKPDVRVVVSPVLGAVDATRPWLPAAITSYDARLAALLPSLSTDASPLTLARTTVGWDAYADTFEGLHPNPTGETLIAQHVAEVFHVLGILPQVPAVFSAHPWTRTEAATVRAAPSAVAVSWRGQAISGTRVYLRRAGQGGIVTRVPGQGSTVIHGLVPHTKYELRLQLVRGHVVGPWGPSSRFATPALPPPPAVARVVIGTTGVSWTAAPGATAYRVSYQVSGSSAWATRSTRSRYYLAAHVVRARIWAVNGNGVSAVTDVRR